MPAYQHEQPVSRASSDVHIKLSFQLVESGASIIIPIQERGTFSDGYKNRLLHFVANCIHQKVPAEISAMEVMILMRHAASKGGTGSEKIGDIKW